VLSNNALLLEKVTKEHDHCAHRSWVRINTLRSHLRARFKRYLNQNMLENALFLKKKEKGAAALGAPPPNLRWPPAAGSCVIPVTCSNYLKIMAYCFMLE